MELYGLQTPIIQPGDNIAIILEQSIQRHDLTLCDKDVLVIAETAVATAQGRIQKLENVRISKRAKDLSEKYSLEPGIAQLVLEEADEILGGVPRVILTIKNNTLLANAGIDRSNAPLGSVVLLPANPTEEAWQIKTALEKDQDIELGVIIADSRTQPLRLGTVGLALAVAGIEPIKDFRGQPDLFGRLLQITRSAIADNLASAAQLLMGEANEQIPAVLIRGAPLAFTTKKITPLAMTISRQECLYCSIFETWTGTQI